MKLFSLGRTVLAVWTKFAPAVAIEKCKDRYWFRCAWNVLIWCTDVPWAVRRWAHWVQSWCDARPASRFMNKIWAISYSSCFDERDTSKDDGDTYISHPMQHLPEFFRKVSIFSSFPKIASEMLPGIDTWYKPFNYPTTHPVYKAPAKRTLIFIDLSN